MTRNRKRHGVIILGALLIVLHPQAAEAYVGPGAGVSAIGAFLAVMVGIVVAIFGFIWYPVKRLIRKMKQRKADKEGSPSA